MTAQDLRFSLRQLFRHPGHTVTAVLALGLGIGLATAMFSIVYGALLRGLPVPAADRLLRVHSANPSHDDPALEVFLHDFLDFRARQRSFQSLAAFYEGTVNLSGDGNPPERFNGVFSSANLFDVLRVPPVHGRAFLPGEDAPAAEPVILLSYGVWQRRYHADPRVVGRPVRINGEAGTIAGVLPPGFGFPLSSEVWVPLRLDPLRIPRGEGKTLDVIGRLRDGVSLEQARADLRAIARALAAEHPQTNRGRIAVVNPWMEEALGGGIAKLLWTMLGACVFVLLIACANVASLMMARASRRTREITIRAALGASRRRLVGHLLLESLLLALCGAGLGVLLAALGVKLFNLGIAASSPPFWMRIAVDPVALLFTLGVTLAAGLLSGLMPALQTSRTDLNEVLKDEGRGSSSLRLGRFSRLVVVAEVAFSCLLLVGTGLMVRSVVRLRTMDLGIDPARRFTGRVTLPAATYPKEADRLAFYDEVLRRLEAQPDVAAAAVGTHLPGGFSGLSPYRAEGRSYPNEQDLPMTHTAEISPAYFEAFGVRLLAGRPFGRLDTATSLPVAIVNQSFAAEAWPGQDPLGRRFRLGDEEGVSNPPWRTVVGVAPDLHMGGLDDVRGWPQGVYLPLAQRPPATATLTARTRTPDPLTLTAAVRQQVSALDPDLPVYLVRSLEEQLARERFFPNLFASLFAIFGGAALVLAAVGIYGVIAFSVQQRTQEIGIRMALGAQQGSVLSLILRRGMGQLLAGLAAGLLGAFFVSHLLVDYLSGIQPRDPLTFLLVSLALALIAFVACWIPARRATRTDPLVAIRYE
ncbi:MAG: ABC transporter permease [Acidobacteria bacterium]|nr:ABC transporter permease [Acidobacteriota bacterium]